MKSTLLNLLTRDGAIAATFSAVLTVEQYEALYEYTRGIENTLEMKNCLEETASRWGLSVIIDEG